MHLAALPYIRGHDMTFERSIVHIDIHFGNSVMTLGRVRTSRSLDLTYLLTGLYILFVFIVGGYPTDRLAIFPVLLHSESVKVTLPLP